MTYDLDIELEAAARFFGKTVAKWCDGAPFEENEAMPLRCTIPMACAALLHEMRPAQSWMQISNGTTELWSSTAHGEIEVAR